MKRLLAAFFFIIFAGGCSAMKSKPSSNVQPPAPGVPATAADVTGIYRSIHQGLLQLRADGDYVLVVSEGPGPTTGSFTLSAGRMSVYSKACGPESGDYDVVVTGEQKAGKAVLNISAVRDSCEDRRKYLTIDPWVYADS
jgi:hypothetical protein